MRVSPKGYIQVPNGYYLRSFNNCLKPVMAFDAGRLASSKGTARPTFAG